MSEILSHYWNYALAGLALIAAIIGAWIGGKNTGTVQTQAKADVTAAKVESAQVSAVAEKQKENTQVVKDVQANNSALSDESARAKLRNSSFNRPE